MKTFFFKYGLGSIIFLFLVFTAFVLIQPTYESLNNQFDLVKKDIVASIEENFGVRLNYASLSPSILSVFFIQDIEIVDIQTKKTVLSINSIFLKYNLPHLITAIVQSKPIGDAFSELIVDEVSVVFGERENEHILRTINTFINRQSVNDSTANEDTRTDNTSVFTGDFFPILITLKKIELAYTDKQDNVYRGILRNFSVDFDEQSQSFKTLADGSIAVILSSPSEKGLNTVGLTFSLDAQVVRSLNELTAVFSLNSLDMTDIAFSSTTFNVTLKDSIFSVHAVTDLPFTLVYELYTETGDMKALFVANDFEPADIAIINAEDTLFTSLEDISLTGVFEASYNASTNELQYSANADTFLPDSIIPQGLDASFNLHGDLQTLFVDSVTAQSPTIDISASGNYNFVNKTPYFDVLVNNFTLANGNSIQAEIFVQEQDEDILIFIPQIDFNGYFLTAFELSILPQEDSADFIFSVSDYTHLEADEPGVISLEGSVLFGEDSFLQSQMTFANIYADSLARLAAFFLPSSVASSLIANAETLSSYIISNEVYISSDFTSFLYNTPAMIIANTQRDREFLILSFSGNENSVNISQLDALAAGQSLQATLAADFAPDYSSLVFSTGFTFNTISYNFNGTFFPGAYLGIEGDYGFESYTTFSEDGTLRGNVQSFGLPLRVAEMISSLTFNVDFTFPNSEDWTAKINQFELNEISNIVSFSPSLRFSGNADKYGLFLNSVTYNDLISTLEGTGRFNWFLFDGIVDNFSADINLQDSITTERIDLLLSVTNPEKKSLSELSAFDNFYVSMETTIRNMRFTRFLTNQTDNDTLNATLSVSGTLNSPFVSARVDSSSVSVGGIPVLFEGVAQLENGYMTLADASIEAVYQNLRNLEAEIDLQSFSGTAEGVFEGQVFKDTITAPFVISLTNSSGDTGITEEFTTSLFDSNMPEVFSVEMRLFDMSGTLAQETTSGFAQLIRTPGRYDFFLGNNRSFYGYYTDSGYIFASSSDPLPLRFLISGNIQDRQVNINVANLFADISKLQFILNYPEYTMYEGILEGSIDITGLITDPEFNGLLTVSNALLTSPKFVLEDVEIDEANFIVEDSVIRSVAEYNGYTIGKAKNGNVLFSLETYFDGWSFYEFKLHFETDTNNYMRAQFTDLAFGSFESDVLCNFDLSIRREDVSFIADLYLDNAEAIINFDSFTDEMTTGNTAAMVDLNIVLGRKVNLFAYLGGNLILRGIAEPQTELHVAADTATSSFGFTGDMALRGGDFLYFSRNFYIREGNISFNLTQSNVDPVVSFQAETRTQDEDGDDVRIYLSVENQLFSQIVPRITSIPSKSENELTALLGQVLVTGSGSDETSLAGTVATVVDYGAQTTLFRNLENQLRKVLNFDIFSLRLPILQNVLLHSLDNDSTADVSPSNYFDNSTVYMGKYFGNALYADALMNLRYDESKINNDLSLGGLVFEPEVGFEMAAPFATIRWSMAPDIGESSNNLLVPYTSISLSWKFAF